MNPIEKEPTPFELSFLIEYQKGGFSNAAGTYRALRPHANRNTCKAEACRLLKRPHVKQLLKRMVQNGGIPETVSQTMEPDDNGNLPVSHMPTDNPVQVTKGTLISEARAIAGEARKKESFTAALKGVELQGRFIGAFEQDEDAAIKYAQFVNHIKAKNININIAPEKQQEVIIETKPDQIDNYTIPTYATQHNGSVEAISEEDRG